MYTLKPTENSEPLAYSPVEKPFDDFCCGFVRSFVVNPNRLTPEWIGQEFRKQFHAPVPLPLTWLRDRLQEFGIELHGLEVWPEKAKALTISDGRAYRVITPYNQPEEAVNLLHELLEIMYSQWLHFSSVWAKMWLEARNVEQVHQLADRFAYAVVMPRQDFCIKAKEYGNNVSALAHHFGVRPATAQDALKYLVSSPCPLFTARLNFRNVPEPMQRAMRFDTESVLAQVWKRVLMKGQGIRHKALEVLGEHFPKQDSVINVDGFAYRAIMEGRELAETTDTILGIKLPAPVFAVARPNGVYRTQLFLQAVPVEYADVLMDAALRAREEEDA